MERRDSWPFMQREGTDVKKPQLHREPVCVNISQYIATSQIQTQLMIYLYSAVVCINIKESIEDSA
jgi:hypothetical protein